MERELAEILGAVATTYPLVLPQHPTYPAIVYQQITGTRELSHEGREMSLPLYQLTLYDDSYAGIKALRDAIVALDGTPGLTDIHRLFVENDRDYYDEDAGVWAGIVDIRIYY